MGIKKLFTFFDKNKLYKTYPYLYDLINDMNLDKNKLLIGIDANLFCYKYSHSYDNMLIGFFNQILKFLSYGYYPLYIFDGGTMIEKEGTNNNRNKKKNINKIKLNKIEELINLENLDDIENNTKLDELLLLKKKFEKNVIRISNNEIKKVIELFDILNIPYIFSSGEGEYLAVLLNNYKIIDLFLSDDTDPIPAGIDYLIKFSNNVVMFLDIKKSLEKLEIDQNQLCDISILLGTDYATFHHSLIPSEIYELIKNHKNIENIFDYIYNNNKYDDNKYEENKNKFLIMINKIRNIYQKSPNNEKELILNPNITIDNYNIISIKKNIDFYSNVMLEHWDELLEILKNNYDEEKVNLYKIKIIKFIKNKKFNIKNILKFLKENIPDITEEELINATNSFTYINNFNCS
jgi:hypothetical protein